MPAAERYDLDRAEARLRAALGDHGFETCWAAGASEPVDALVAELLPHAASRAGMASDQA